MSAEKEFDTLEAANPAKLLLDKQTEKSGYYMHH